MTIEIYTDGACSGNPGIGGWGVIILQKQQIINTLSGNEKYTTNNRMEMMAAIKALQYMHNTKSKLEINLYTDSIYVKNGITKWLFNWKKRNWHTANGDKVKNKDLWQILDNITKLLQINWYWLKGHAGNKYNEQADNLAKQALLKIKS